MAKTHLILGSILAGLAVATGAFGAHLVSHLLEVNGREGTYNTAVQYHQFHAIVILIVSLLMQKRPSRILKNVNLLFLSGLIFFSGSLYVLALTNLAILGALAPIGGICFLAGWIILIYYLIRYY